MTLKTVTIAAAALMGITSLATAQAKKFLDQVRPIVEEHLKARGYNLAELDRDNELLASLPRDRLPPASQT